MTEYDLVGFGGDLEPETLLSAYRSGLFPMHHHGRLAWWSPDPRGVIPLDGLRVSRSLRRSAARFTLTADAAFEAVIDECASPDRAGRWINDEIRAAYIRMHWLGWAHSVEAWSLDGALVGGLYGISIGGFFAGESMFHRATDASKVALMGLVSRLRSAGATLLDVQWCTDHLASLGAVEIPRRRYLELLAVAVGRPVRAFGGAS